MSAAGRPAKADPETVQLAQRLLELHEYGVTVATIAKRERLSESWIFDLLKIGRAHRAEAEAPPPEPQAEPVAAARAPRKLSWSRVLQRAYAANRQPELRERLTAEQRMVWLDMLHQINTFAPDGIHLQFGPRPLFFDSRTVFLAWMGRAEDELRRLCDLRILEELPGGSGLAIPDLFDLIPRPKLPRGMRKAEADGQTFMLHALPRRRPEREADSAPTGVRPESHYAETGGFPGVFPESDSGNIASRARGLTTDDKNPAALSSVISLGRAGAHATEGSGETPVEGSGETPVEGSGETPVEGSGETPVTAVALAAALAKVAKLDKQPSGQDIGLVQRWLNDRLPPAVILATAKVTAARATQRIASIRYFEPEITEALTALDEIRRVAARPAVPLSDAGLALAARLRPASDAWTRDPTCPWPPTIGSYGDAVAAGNGALADRWIAAFATWDRQGRPAAARPPEFVLLRLDRAQFASGLDNAERAAVAPKAGTG